jgi:GxxExxY protein
METNDLTEVVIGAAFKVQNTLGCGFLERIYENALVHELRKRGLLVQQQIPYDVYYDDVIVGQYVADLLVENRLIVEAKTAKGIDDAHVSQCLNYLKASGLKIGLVLNFGTPQVQVKRLLR